jgi:Tfp pilus assembly protein PilX
MKIFRTRKRRKTVERQPRQTAIPSNMSNESGFALIMALVISLAVFILIVGMLYFTTRSTTMTGAGKRYATACEAADGVVEIVKDAVMHSDSLPAGFPTACTESYDFTWAVGQVSQICTLNFTSLQGTVLGTTYNATAKINMTGSGVSPGYRIEFPPRAYAGGGNGISSVYRIYIKVAGPNNTSCENSVLFRNFK